MPGSVGDGEITSRLCPEPLDSRGEGEMCPPAAEPPLCPQFGHRGWQERDAVGSAPSPSPPCQGTGLRGQCQSRAGLISWHPLAVGPKESSLQRRSCSNLGSPAREGTGRERRRHCGVLDAQVGAALLWHGLLGDTAAALCVAFRASCVN